MSTAFSPNPQALTVPFLKQLYGLLVKLSSNGSVSLERDRLGNAISLRVCNQSLVTKVNYSDITDISILLFKQLCEKFELLLEGPSSLPLDGDFYPEGFILLLRCSFAVLRFIGFDLADPLVALVGKLCPPNSSLRPPIESDSHTSTNIFPAILEVFINEFLMHQELRKHFIMTYCISGTKEKLFGSHCSSSDDVQAIMELVSGHFLVSVYDELTFNGFIQMLSWSNEVDNGAPAINLASSLALLANPLIRSAPNLLKAHLVVLASRCICVNMSNDVNKLDTVQANLYILAFELSVKVYSDFTSIPSFTEDATGDKTGPGFVSNGRSFSSCVRPMTFDKLRHQIDRLIGFSHHCLHDLHSQTETEMLNNCIAYIKGSQHCIDEAFRDEACSILSSIVKCFLLRESEWLHEDEHNMQKEIYSAAAALKLMSSSLSQIVCFLRRHSGDLKTTEQLICKEYDHVLCTISCFRKLAENQQNYKFLNDKIGTTMRGHKEIEIMFSHFANLLSYSVMKKTDLIWKGCVQVMFSLMNLLIIGEGNLDAFLPFLDNSNKATFSHSDASKTLKDSGYKLRSSVKIASSLKKVRDQIKYLQHDDSRMDNENTVKETKTAGGNSEDSDNHNTCTNEANSCNGESYLKCLPGYQNNELEWEDLVDFIECQAGKDYSDWLKKREVYRGWKFKKMASIKQKFKRTAFMKHNFRSKKRKHVASCSR